MGETTGIGWTDATFNGWIGCTKVAEECDSCYAARDNNLHKWNGGEWGPGTLRKITSDVNWNKPFVWDRKAAAEGVTTKVFGYSLADIWDAESPLWPFDRVVPGYKKNAQVPIYPKATMARQVFFEQVVHRTPHLMWLLLTKRFERAAVGYGKLWGDNPWPNVASIFSAGNQKNLDHCMKPLREINAVVRGISAEPLLGPLDLREHLPYLQWVIVGGESGPNFRPLYLEWVRDIQAQCKQAGVAFFMKQTGHRYFETLPNGRTAGHIARHRAGADILEWPLDIRVQEFPKQFQLVA